MRLLSYKLFENYSPYNYYKMMIDLDKENIIKYKNSNYPVLNMMVDPLPNYAKERTFLNSLVNKMGNNKISFNQYVKPKVLKLQNMNQSIRENLMLSDEPRLLSKETLQYLYNNRELIYTEDIMNNIFKKLFIISVTSLIAERSMIEFLEINGYNILKTSSDDDIFKGIDITATKGESKLTFQVKSVLYDNNIKIIDNNEYIDINTSLDLSHTVDLKYDYISFVTPDRIITAPRKNLIITKKNGGFTIKSGNIQSRNYKTNYSDKKTNTFLDDVFLK
ncbi:hypothetical protein M0Q50_03025 [bacterium]|jgi:Holliday junction resolvase|nr:hypothetical protein [bacterium]